MRTRSGTGRHAGKGNTLLGALATAVYCAIVTFVLLKLIDAVMGLRVSEEEEREGLDISSHGETAYHR